jgi:fluoride exporter
MTLTNILLVGLGGFLGSIARYLCTVFIDEKANTSFPFGTFTVNIAGAFILGLVYAWASRSSHDVSSLRIFLITGFCGGFTTFSAFAFENFGLINNRSVAISLAYISLTVVSGIVAVWFGIMLMKKIG